MKMKILFIVVVIVFESVALRAQDLSSNAQNYYNITFSGSGVSFQKVLVENRTKKTQIELNPTDVLRLVLPVTAIDNISENQKKILVYPNPMNQSCHIRIDDVFEGVVNFQIVDLNGKQQVNYPLNAINGAINIKLSGVPSGVYIIRLFSSQFDYMSKLISIGSSKNNGIKPEVEIEASQPLPNNIPIRKILSAREEVKDLQYTTGDELKIIGMASGYINDTIIDSPAAGKQYTFNFEPIKLPSINTTSISGITAINATGGGSITSTGGAPITARGICWSTSSNPDLSNSKTINGAGAGTFSGSITGLSTNMTYYVRAYATNSVGTSYGQQVTFNTNLPNVSGTSVISSITATKATGGGTITSNGCPPITARGICWSTSFNPDLNDAKSNDGTGNGMFTSTITGLSTNVIYYVRAYATNSVGTSYGQQVTFNTKLPTVTSTSAIKFSAYAIESGGSISDEGGSDVIGRGVCWTDNFASPTILNNKTSDAAGTGLFYSRMLMFSSGRDYKVRAYATNSIGTAYGPEVSFTTKLPTVTTGSVTVSGTSVLVNGNVTTPTGSAPITEKGVYYSKTANTPTSGVSYTSGAGTISKTIYVTSPGTYYYRCYAINCFGTYYGDTKTFVVK